jgi:serine/threonine protein kinase
MDRLENLAASQKRKLYELCWQFEEAWSQNHSISPNDWVSKIDDVNSEIVLRELRETLTELEMKSSSTGQRSLVDTDRYEFLEEIARGGAAVVWRVRDRNLQRQSAIKYLMHSQDNREMRSRLRREARICAKLVHPGIVPIHELSSFEDGRPFVCMKLIEGKTLLQLLRSSPPASTESLMEVFAKACQAMAYAHEQNIIHRDLSPSNIMVGLFGEVQIMDWGLAKDLANNVSDEEEDNLPNQNSESEYRNKMHSDESSTIKIQGEQTIVGSVFGTIAYLSPEQACGHTDQIDKRSDVFSLGAILCRLLTGSPPYENTDPAKLLKLAQNAELVQAALRLNQSRFRDLSNLALQCMSVDPNSRPKDATEIVTELNRIRVATQQRKTILQFSAIALLVASGFAFAFFRPYFVLNTTPPTVHSTESESVALETDPASIQKLLDTGKRDIVLKSYRAFLEANPSDSALHYLICTLLVNAERYAESESVGLQLVQLNDKSPQYFFMLSEAQYYLGKIKESYASLKEAAARRDNGIAIQLPVDQKLATRQKQVLWLSQLESSQTPPKCEPSELLDLGQACELTNRFELATSYYNQSLEQYADPCEKSFHRFLLLVGFVRKSIAKVDLSTPQRGIVFTAAMDWLEKQIAFLNDATECKSPDGIDSIKKELIKELRQGDSGKIVKAACADPNLTLELRDRFKVMAQSIEELR